MVNSTIKSVRLNPNSCVKGSNIEVYATIELWLGVIETITVKVTMTGVGEFYRTALTVWMGENEYKITTFSTAASPPGKYDVCVEMA